jgi:predicted acylesterase/phospholipase RssA
MEKYLKDEVTMKHFVILCTICALCFFLAGCGVIIGTAVDSVTEFATYPMKEFVFHGAYKYDNTWTAPYAPIQYERDYGELLLGLAVSGGGSRSAYFLACVLEELSHIPLRPGSKKTYLDELDYISSVSGGSLASAYYCLMKYHPKHRHNTDNFFMHFKENMSKNFQARVMLYYVIYGRWFLDLFTYYDRGDILAGVWDDMFFHDMTFQDLHLAERNGAPTLLINGTNMNDGLKFVFSTLADRHFNGCSYFEQIGDSGFNHHYDVPTEYRALHSVGFEGLNSDIRPYRISKAVIASASVPNLLGPVTLRDCSVTTKYVRRLINIVDGGVYDNYGIETLMQVMGNILEKKPNSPAKILVVDGAGYFLEDDKTNDSYTVADYSSRPLEIAWMRNRAYVEYIFQKANQYINEKGEQPYSNLSFDLLSLYQRLPSQDEFQEKKSRDAIEKVMRLDQTATDYLKKLVNIKTLFKLSDEDAKMIEKSAKNVVQSLKRGKE